MYGADIKCTYVSHKSWMEELLEDLGVCMRGQYEERYKKKCVKMGTEFVLSTLL
jgi:hypothetical protein